jgi:hypothetical protein
VAFLFIFYYKQSSMKHFYILCLLVIGFSADAQIINIPDANFKNALVNTLCVGDWETGDGGPTSDVDVNNDGEIQVSEAAAVQILPKYCIARRNSGFYKPSCAQLPV